LPKDFPVRLPTLLGFFFLATSAIACAHNTSNEDAEASSDELITHERNQDVQVLKVYDAQSFSVSKGSIYPALNQEDCKPEGKTWTEIKAWDVAVSGHLAVKLDCTEAFQQKYGFPSMRAVKLDGYRTRTQEQDYYGYVGFSNSMGAFWVKTIELVVKQGAIDASSFNGIGFYLNSFSYPYYQARPAPGPDNGNGHFMFASQVRAQANQYPAATLANGEKVRVIKVLLPSQYAMGGSSYVPAFYFRPFAEYVDGADKHQRWDIVASDYFVGIGTQFNREGDVLTR
jgi:hypothetical protein